MLRVSPLGMPMTDGEAPRRPGSTRQHGPMHGIRLPDGLHVSLACVAPVHPSGPHRDALAGVLGARVHMREMLRACEPLIEVPSLDASAIRVPAALKVRTTRGWLPWRAGQDHGRPRVHGEGRLVVQRLETESHANRVPSFCPRVPSHLHERKQCIPQARIDRCLCLGCVRSAEVVHDRRYERRILTTYIVRVLELRKTRRRRREMADHGIEERHFHIAQSKRRGELCEPGRLRLTPCASPWKKHARRKGRRTLVQHGARGGILPQRHPSSSSSSADDASVARRCTSTS